MNNLQLFNEIEPPSKCFGKFLAEKITVLSSLLLWYSRLKDVRCIYLRVILKLCALQTNKRTTISHACFVKMLNFHSFSLSRTFVNT